ncbi:MAG TPA: competence/damage-inducible protein A [Thermodesulfovibrionales bacterium]|nr:competence/damage-inducible protein A [Thermodesulfovibrionales bacterium]
MTNVSGPGEYNAPRSAGILIIGNEILSGKVKDSNSSFLASELRALGVCLMRISVIPDDIEVIGREAVQFSEAYDLVFTSGGVGPTHDDVTTEGIAKGFKVKVVPHPELVAYFHTHYGDRVNPAIMKMAEVPEGAELIHAPGMGFPLVLFKNIFILPGIPQYLIKKFSVIKERFRSTAIHLKRLFLRANESDIAETLNSVVRTYSDVAFGSYPILENPEYSIIVTAESRSEDALNQSVAELISRLPRTVIVRAE